MSGRAGSGCLTEEIGNVVNVDLTNEETVGRQLWRQENLEQDLDRTTEYVESDTNASSFKDVKCVTD